MKLLNIFIITSLIANIIANSVSGCCCIKRKKKPITTAPIPPDTYSEPSGQAPLRASSGRIVHPQPTYHGDSISNGEIIREMKCYKQKFILTAIPYAEFENTPVCTPFYKRLSTMATK